MLLKQHQLPLFAYASELLREREAALDVVQETFASAVRHVGSLRDDTRFASWLFGIAHQKCVQHWRRLRRDGDIFAPGTDDAPVEAMPDGDAIDSRALLLRREQAEEFFALMDKLPSAQRSVLLLHVVEEFSLEEIATITAVPLGTVKSRLHHAKRALRHLVETTR